VGVGPQVVWSAGDGRNAVSPVSFFPGRRAQARPAQRAVQTSRFCDMTEHIGLLAAAYAFHAGVSRQAAVAAQVRAMEEPSTVRAGEEQHQLPSEPVPPGRQGGRDPAASAPQTSAPAGSRPPPVDPHSLPGPRRLPVRARRPGAVGGGWRAGVGAGRGRPPPGGGRPLGSGHPGRGRPGRQPRLGLRTSTSPPAPPRGHACRGETGRPCGGAAGRPPCQSRCNVPTWPETPPARHGRPR
jgi:hypothetical protein